MICFDDIRAAANTLAGQVTRTALQRSRVLSKMTGAEVYLKFETFQFTASFKERGALNKLASLSEAERQVGVVAMSAGNHARDVACHARRLGIDSTIVMPVNTPFTKIRNTRDLGATVVLHGENLAEAQGKMEELVAEGRTLVHPYDDPLVMAGQGTVALEMLEDQPDLDTLVGDVVNKDPTQAGKWERVMRVPMRFNRLVLFSPWQFRNAAPGFGTDAESARLVMLLFFGRAAG